MSVNSLRHRKVIKLITIIWRFGFCHTPLSSCKGSGNGNFESSSGQSPTSWKLVSSSNRDIYTTELINTLSFKKFT